MIRQLVLLAIGCIAGAIAILPLHAGEPEFTRPPYAGAYEPQGVDERGLWMDLDDHERSFRHAPAIIGDENLNAFVHGVLCRTIGEDRCGSVRVYVIQEGSFNASMAPNGLMLVHVGLLARMHSEAELATILGHEFGHFELRHSLNAFRKRRRATDALAWISLAGAVTNQNTTAISNSIAIGYLSFSRDQETEADYLSAQYVRASAYRLRASEVWKRALAEDDALRTERGLRKIRRTVPSLTDTHPTELQRLNYFKKLEQEAGNEGEDGLESYRAATNPVLPLLFESLVKGNDFGAADYVIKARGDALGWDAQLLFMRGELYRQRANPRDLVTARDLFQQAIAHSEAPAESWRGLGLSTLRLGEVEAGRAALAEYLKRLPAARDAAAIKMLLEN